MFDADRQRSEEEIAVSVKSISKRFRLFSSPNDKLREILTFGRNERGHDFWALRDISFDVTRGTALGIIGRNGSGKSTLLKIICQTLFPTAGETRVDGRVSSLLELGIGFNSELSGKENVYLQGAIMGYSKREMDKRSPIIEEFADIGEFINQPVKHYSSGMLVRLGFACAINVDPDILIIDEALAVGDGLFQKKCFSKIEEFRESKKTLILVSHSMDVINLYCSKAILLNEGRIVAQGAPLSVIETYQEMLFGVSQAGIPFGKRIFDSSRSRIEAGFIVAYVVNSNQSSYGSLVYSKDFMLVFEVQVQTLVTGLRVGFRLRNKRFQSVLHAATSDQSLVDKQLGLPGRYRVSAQIPGNWLSPGRYLVELGLWAPGRGHLEHYDQALAFDILADNPNVESIGTDVLRPVLPWVIDRME